MKWRCHYLPLNTVHPPDARSGHGRSPLPNLGLQSGSELDLSLPRCNGISHRAMGCHHRLMGCHIIQWDATLFTSLLAVSCASAAAVFRTLFPPSLSSSRLVYGLSGLHHSFIPVQKPLYCFVALNLAQLNSGLNRAFFHLRSTSSASPC